MKKSKVALGLALFVSALALLANVALANQIGAENNFTLEKGGRIEDNAYLVAGNVNVLGDVEGDLLGAGGNVLISGTVGDDVLTAGGGTNLLGDIQGDARLGGGNIVVGGNVGGDLMAAGGSINVLAGSKVGKDLYLAGGEVNVNADLAGEAKIAGGKVKLNGTFAGPVLVKTGELTIGDDAVIEGDLTYYAPKEASISESAQVRGKITYHKAAGADAGDFKEGIAAFFGLAYFMKFLAMIATGLVFVLGLKKISAEIVALPMKKFGAETLRGLVLLIALPVAALILMITLIGFPLGILTILFWLFISVLGCIFAGPLLGVWVSKLWHKKEKVELNWKNALLGIVLLFVLGFIPVIGCLITFIFFLATLGAVANLLYGKIKD